MDSILASTSAYRRALLERLGVPFRTEDPQVDEGAVGQGIRDPTALAQALAVAKADAVARRFPHSVVVGSDQLVALDDRVLGKPGTFERAVAQLTALAGRTHLLITAMAVRSGTSCRTHVDRTQLTVRDLDRAEIERYVGADQPLDCAGAYKLESRGIALFEQIESEDHSAIVGLPLIALTSILRELGFSIP